MSEDERRLLDSALSGSLEANLAAINHVFHSPRNSSLVIRRFSLGRRNGGLKAALVFLDDIVDTAAIRDTILKALFRIEGAGLPGARLQDTIVRSVPGAIVLRALAYSEVVSGLVEGSTVLLVDGARWALLWDTRSIEHRAIGESPAEAIVRGPHTGFVEDQRTNLALIRLHLATPDLVCERTHVGARSNVPFAIVYLEGVANPKLVREVKRRVSSVKADFVPSADMLKSFIEDQPNSPLPSVLVTERPDRVAGMLAEGHVAIVSPSAGVAVVPVTIWDLMHSPEDYYLHYIPASTVRLIRWLALFTTVYSSALYVAVTNYHPEMIPTELLSVIASAREAVPFPAVLEVVTMEVALELIREASVRIPATFGPTIGVVGAVVLGQAAVMANLVNPILVVVVAISGLGAFAVPNYELGVVLRLTKFIMIFAASIAGAPAVTAVTVVLLARLCVSYSFGVPVTAPVIPHREHSPDTFLRGPVWAMERRPGQLHPANSRRQAGRSRS